MFFWNSVACSMIQQMLAIWSPVSLPFLNPAWTSGSSWHKEGWASKNWCFWTVVLEKTLESPLDSKKIKPVNPKLSQSWIFIGRTNAEAEAPIHGYLIWRVNSLEKTLMFRKTKGKRRSGQQRMRCLDGITNSMNMRLSKLQDGDGQGGLACCSPWDHQESDMTEWLNWTELNQRNLQI